MTDRELMQMALAVFDWLEARTIYQDGKIKEVHKTLRDRIAQPESEPANPVTWEFESLAHAMLGEGKPFYRSGKKINLSAMRSGEKFILVRTGQVYSIKDNGSVWNETENRPSRLHKNCQVEPLYTTPVHAIDISQERVDETTKCGHEPVAWHEPGAYGNVTTHKDWALANGWEPLYTAPPKREWVGLTDEERFLNDARSAEEIEYAKAIEAKLKEKNT